MWGLLRSLHQSANMPQDSFRGFILRYKLYHIREYGWIDMCSILPTHSSERNFVEKL